MLVLLPAQDRPQQVSLCPGSTRNSAEASGHARSGSRKGRRCFHCLTIPTTPQSHGNSTAPNKECAVSALGPNYPDYLDLGVPERKTLHISRRNCTVGKTNMKKKNPSQHAFILNKTTFSMMQWEESLGLEKATEPSVGKSEFQLSSVLTRHPI